MYGIFTCCNKKVGAIMQPHGCGAWPLIEPSCFCIDIPAELGLGGSVLLRVWCVSYVLTLWLIESTSSECLMCSQCCRKCCVWGMYRLKCLGRIILTGNDVLPHLGAGWRGGKAGVWGEAAHRIAQMETQLQDHTTLKTQGFWITLRCYRARVLFRQHRCTQSVAWT